MMYCLHVHTTSADSWWLSFQKVWEAQAEPQPSAASVQAGFQ